MAHVTRDLTSAGSFSRGCPCGASKSREIDSMAPVGRFDSTRVTVPDRRAQAPGFGALYKCLPIPRNIGLPSFFAGFLPWLGVRRGETPVATCARLGWAWSAHSIMGA